MEARMKTDELKSYYVKVASNACLHVYEAGEGRPVILIHGWPLSNEVFLYQYEALSKHCRVIGISLRGFGKSDKPSSDYTFDMHASDIDQVINALKVKKAILLGYSFGGAVAAHYIAKFKPAAVSQLVLLSANVPLSTKSEDHPYGFTVEELDYLIAELPQQRTLLTDIYGPLSKLTEQDMPPADAEWINKTMADTSEEALVKSIVALKYLDLRPQMPDIQIPTAIFHAKDDLTIPADIAIEAHEQIAGSTLFMYDTGGHYLLLTRKDQFNTDLINLIG